MLQVLESVVETLITGAQSLREFTYPYALGSLQRIDIVSDTVNGAGVSTFDLLLNGVTIFPGGGGRPTIAAGADSGSVTGLATALVRFDKLRLTAVGAPVGGIGAKLYLMLTIEDGATTAPSGAAGGDLSGTYPNPGVSGLKGRSIGGIPNVAGFVQDNFNDNAYDGAFWTVYGGAEGTIIAQNQRLEIKSISGSTIGLYSVPLDARGKYIAISAQCIAGGAGIAGSFMIGQETSDYNGSNSGARFHIAGATLQGYHFRHFVANDLIFNIAYDAVAHRYLRFRHDNGANLLYWETSPDGVTWTSQGSSSIAQSSAVDMSAVRIKLQEWNGGNNAEFRVDDFLTNIPETDALTGANLYGLVWDEGANQFTVARTIGLIKLVTVDPAGAPSNVPVGYTEARFNSSNNTLWIWDGGAWQSQVF